SRRGRTYVSCLRLIPRISGTRQELRALSSLRNSPCQFRARNRHLFTGGEMLQREGIGLHFVFADNQNVAGSDSVGGLEGLFQAKGLVAEFDNQIGSRTAPAQLARQTSRFAIHAGSQWRDVDIGLAHNRFGRSSQRKNQPVFPDGKSNARSRRAAQRLRQAVVSSAAQ